MPLICGNLYKLSRNICCQKFLISLVGEDAFPGDYLLIALYQHRSHEPHERGFIGKYTDDFRATFKLLVLRFLISYTLFSDVNPLLVRVYI